jgi:ATP-dependent DNA helicase 2 subunit 2
MIQRRDVDKVDEAVAQMEEVIRGLIAGSVHGHLFGKAIECLECLRRGCVLEGEAERFNLYLRSLKGQHLGGQFWQAVVRADVTLIHEEESGDSEVSRQEAEHFLRDNVPSIVVPEAAPADDSDEIDLFGQME